MKKQLLITATFLIASIVASAQAIVTTDDGVNSFSVTEIAGVAVNAEPYVKNGNITTVIATTKDVAAYQLRGTTKITNDLKSKFEFDAQTASGTVVGSLSFDFRKLATAIGAGGGGTDAVITVTVGAMTPQTFTYTGTNGTNVTGKVTGYDEYIVSFVGDIIFSTTPVHITFEIADLDMGSYLPVTNTPAARLYSAFISKGTLSTIDFQSKENLFVVYPNPVNNSFQINSKVDVKNVAIYTVTGQLVKTLAPTTSYDISDLKSGIYLATITAESGSETVKIVKR